MESILETDKPYLTDSKFFVPEFNTAIFADPFRIYFSNHHESFALEIYHHLMTHFDKRVPEGAIDQEDLIFFMLYDDAEKFSKIFNSNEKNQIEFSKFNGNWVVGISGVVKSEPIEFLMSKISEIIDESFSTEYNFKSLKTH